MPWLSSRSGTICGNVVLSPVRALNTCQSAAGVFAWVCLSGALWPVCLPTLQSEFAADVLSLKTLPVAPAPLPAGPRRLDWCPAHPCHHPRVGQRAGRLPAFPCPAGLSWLPILPPPQVP